MKLYKFLFIILFIFSNDLWAAQITKTFSDISERDNSELIWNVLTSKLLPPIYIRNYDDGLGFKNLDIDPGDGIHGDFTIVTYSSFSQNSDISGNIIRINTDLYTQLEFQNFILEEGWTLRPIGTQPLNIKVLGDMVINGVIDCSGSDGQDLNGNLNIAPLGGEAVCGGGSGGDGGSLTSSPQSGNAGGNSVTGGAFGPVISLTMGQGGGGGGAYGDIGGGKDPKNGDDSTGGIGGAKGTQFTDDAFDEIGGGSGGGGGSIYSNSSAGLDSAGGGGGGGGGVIKIIVLGDVTIGTNGKVLANGGNGGGNNTGMRAGGGGGGGGGSIAIYAAGDIIND
ncbi:MAG: hypothetical protein KDD40_07995, partial [Bdellovibrionales bacterium]|nr:hypothetical protein [Bdellovibrionales bacterium]